MGWGGTWNMSLGTAGTIPDLSQGTTSATDCFFESIKMFPFLEGFGKQLRSLEIG